jgi:ABC-2 type transport system permease protein
VNAPARPSRPLSKYVAVAAVALRQGFAHRGVALGRCGFFVVLLLVFSRLWKTVLGAAPGSGASDYLWYLAATEWVALGIPLSHLDVERDVRSGEIAYALPRPVSYVAAKVAEGFGSLLSRMVLLGVTGFAAAWALSGSLPRDPRGLLLCVPLALLAGLLGVVCGVAIGVGAFWLQDAAPLYWVWQKLTFVLGGLILPLTVYPGWLRAVAEWTPFAAMLYGPGRTALGFDPAAAATTAALLLGWSGLAILFLAWVYRRGLCVLDVNGG